MSRQWVSYEEWAAVKGLTTLTAQRDEARDLAMLFETRLAAIEFAHSSEHHCDDLQWHDHGAPCPTWLLAHGVADDSPGAAGDGEAQPYRAPSR